jgi:hypothetical protein
LGGTRSGQRIGFEKPTRHIGGGAEMQHPLGDVVVVRRQPRRQWRGCIVAPGYRANENEQRSQGSSGGLNAVCRPVYGRGMIAEREHIIFLYQKALNEACDVLKCESGSLGWVARPPGMHIKLVVLFGKFFRTWYNELDRQYSHRFPCMHRGKFFKLPSFSLTIKRYRTSIVS